MIFIDFEVYKYDWCCVYLDTKTREYRYIANDKLKFEKFYEKYKNEIWVAYNGKNYDLWVAKAILSDFNPYDMSNWIIEKNKKGFEYSRVLNKFEILMYNCSVGFRGLKELEAFSGKSIIETSVPFDTDRKLTNYEMQEVLKYCKYDVECLFEVFVETKEEFESHIGLIEEFKLPINMIVKTKAQLSAEILNASKIKRNDEFDISIPDNIILGKYEYIKEHFINWAENIRDYELITLKTIVAGVDSVLGAGGFHSSIDGYIGDGYFLMIDAVSYYPNGMVEYDFLSRNVMNKNKFKTILDERVRMKIAKDKRQAPRKIVLNSTFGASNDIYNKLYDPLQAINLCIACQLFLVDLIEKLEGHCQLIQGNTDGILIKLYDENDREKIIDICKEWEKRTKFTLEFDEYGKVFQRDVNNYIIVPHGDLYDKKGNELFKRKGAVVKKLNVLDNDLPIVNKAVVNYFLYNTPVETTILNETKLINFQKITKISGKYEFGFHNGKVLNEKVHRCFASTDNSDGTLYKKHKCKDTMDKTTSTPEKCFILNCNILDVAIPKKLDFNWYIDLAKKRIEEFC